MLYHLSHTPAFERWSFKGTDRENNGWDGRE
jgi:hypothetical protein